MTTLSAMAEVKTRATDADVSQFLDSVADERRRGEGHELRALMEGITGQPARMWGPSMVGFGEQPYSTTSTTYDIFVVGFSPRKGALTLYGLQDDEATDDSLLARLGPHTTGKSCLYLKRLADVDHEVLGRLVRDAWDRRTAEGAAADS